MMTAKDGRGASVGENLHTRALVLLAAAVVATSACREPTQITVELSTDVACAEARATTVTLGLPGQLEEGEPAVVSSACEAVGSRGELGTVVLVPSGDDDAPVGVKVTLAVTDDAVEDCSKEYGPHCIVARRSLRYLPHTPLVLPIELSRICQGVFCDEDTTCQNGVCVDATVDPNDCAAPPGCVPGGPGGSGGAGGGGAGGGGGGGSSACGEPSLGDLLPLSPGTTTNELRSLVVTPDSGSCDWLVAWANASGFCVGQVSGTSTTTIVTCESPGGDIARVDLASVAGHHLVVTSGPSSGVLVYQFQREPNPQLIPLAVPQNFVTKRLGSVDASADSVLLIEQDGALGTLLGAHRYVWDDPSGTFMAGAPRALTLAPGIEPTALDVSWVDNEVALGLAAGLPFGVGPMPLTNAPVTAVSIGPDLAATRVAVAARGTRRAGFFVDQESTARLESIGDQTISTLWPLGSLTMGDVIANAQLVGATSAWVASVRKNDDAYLFRQDGIGVIHLLPFPVQDVAVGARGDQLLLAWQNTAGAVELRLVPVDFEGGDLEP